jgi:hypothetical protein
MGCDEVWEAGLVGPLTLNLRAVWAKVTAGRPTVLVGQVTGRTSRVGWSFGDGSVLTNVSLLTTSYAWTNAGDYTVTFSAYNTDNPAGVSTNVVITVVPLLAPALSTGPVVGNSFNLSFFAQPLVSYIVEQTTNLAPPISWQSVGNVFGQDNTVQITDTSATNTMRFYRVRSQ